MAMLAGMAAYHELEADRQHAQTFRIRRDVHRLEKGLASSPRRNRFGEGFIGPLVDAVLLLRGEVASTGGTSGQIELLGWAEDVITQYFATVDPSPVISTAERLFRSDGSGRPFAGRVPAGVPSGPPPVSVESLLALATRRHSVRHFLDVSVDREAIDRAVDVARQSPSACNRQAFEFRIYDDPKLAAEVAAIAPGFDPQGRCVPVMVAVVGKYRAYFRERDMHVIYIDASLATMAFALGIEAQGLASCCINWPSLPQVDARMSRMLNLDDDEEVVMLLAVGHPDPAALTPHSAKVPLEILRRYNP